MNTIKQIAQLQSEDFDNIVIILDEAKAPGSGKSIKRLADYAIHVVKVLKDKGLQAPTLKKYFAEIGQMLSHHIKTDNTLITHNSRLRKEISKLFPTQPELSATISNSARTIKRNTKSNQVAEARHDTAITFTEDQIRALIKKLVELSETNINAVPLLFELVLGSRIGETISGSTFTALPGNLVRQTGVLKKKDNTLITIDKPILKGVDSTWLINKLAEYRAKYNIVPGVFDLKKVNSQNTKLNKLLRTILPKAADQAREVSSHILRAIYVNAAFEAYAPPNETLVGFIKRVLGHESTDIAKAYQIIKIVKPGCKINL